MPLPLADKLRRSPAAAGSRFEDGGSPSRPAPRRRARVVAAATIVVAAVAVAAIATLGSSSPRRPGSAAGLAAGEGTATVERRTLTEHAQANGTLGYGSSLELYDRLSGTFTWLPSVGAVIGRGDTLWRIDDLPVALMYGSVPAYRTLKLGVGDGPDVAELNANLVALGFDPYGSIGDHEDFGEATAEAVRRWQQTEGLPESGEVELGRVVFAPGPRRVTVVHVSLGQDPPGRFSSTTPSSTTPASTTPASKAPAKESRANEGSPAKGSPGEEAKAKEGKGASGSGAGAGQVTLATTSTQQLVQLQLKADQQQLARVGEATPVTLPDGRTVEGHIANVGSVASESSENEREKGGNGGGGGAGGGAGNGENATIAVTVALDHPVARLDKAPVSVELVKEVRRDVLAVPATALVATAGGGYAVQALEGGRRTQLAVTPGMFANGYVQVEGASVREGMNVVVPQ